MTEGKESRAAGSAVEEEERVPFERLLQELEWSKNTLKRYLTLARRTVVAFPDPRDNRKKLYPLPHTLKVLRREQARVQARRDRARDEGASYWLALAELKVAALHLGGVAADLGAASRKVSQAYQSLRRRPPTVTLEILRLPDAGLALSCALPVLVSPLRLTYWRAVSPEIPQVWGEGASPEKAVAGLRQALAEEYRLLQGNPAADRVLWEILNDFIRQKRPRAYRKSPGTRRTGARD